MNVEQAHEYVRRLAAKRGVDDLTVALECVAILTSTLEVINGIIHGQNADGVLLVPCNGPTWTVRIGEWESSGDGGTGKHD